MPRRPPSPRRVLPQELGRIVLEMAGRGLPWRRIVMALNSARIWAPTQLNPWTVASLKRRMETAVPEARARIAEAWRRRRWLAAALRRGRPITRGECIGGLRPCPWVGCRYHLLGEVAGEPDDPLAIVETCALDVADRGEHTQVDVGRMLGVSGARISQIESEALARVRWIMEDEDHES